MGGANSCLIPRNRDPNLAHENHTRAPKFKGSKHSVSAAFNLAEAGLEPGVEQLNINTATEEELMTLPGINRSTAHNIVDYRRQIGGFKKVEDLALVSGVGATKLNQIRMEICVRPKKASQSSSLNSSRNDVSTQDNISKSSLRSHNRLTLPVKVNVNTANVFQLMKVKGVTQVIAESIVAYRDKKGSFRSVDDLVKIKGVSPAVLSSIKLYLVLEDEPIQRASSVQMNGLIPHANPSHNRSLSYTNGCAGGGHAPDPTSLGSQDDLLFTYGPLSKKSFRRRTSPVSFHQERRPVVRIATWNLQNCTKEKAENPGVKEVVGMTILENGISLLAFQELTDPSTLQKICDELNRPTIPTLKKFDGHLGYWKYTVSGPAGPLGKDSEHLGFLYDSSRGIELLDCQLIDLSHSEDSNSSLHNQTSVASKAFMGNFKMDSWQFSVVNLHFDAPVSSGPGGDNGLQTEMDWDTVVSTLDEQADGHESILMGSVATLPTEKYLAGFQAPPEHQDSPLMMRPAHTRPVHHHDKIWLRSKSKALATGRSGVVKEGLTSPWIPDGWSWGGAVSDHCPVWVELYADGGQTMLTQLLKTIGLSSSLSSNDDSPGDGTASRRQSVKNNAADVSNNNNVTENTHKQPVES